MSDERKLVNDGSGWGTCLECGDQCELWEGICASGCDIKPNTSNGKDPWMFGEISGPIFQLTCGCCREETIEDLTETMGGYVDNYDQAGELGWSINGTSSWSYESIIRCPKCTVTEPCPNCGKTSLIAIADVKISICMECEIERLGETLTSS